MVSRPRPDHVTAQPFTTPGRRPARPPFKIALTHDDGTELLTITEENGLLVVGGDESRWAESVPRFVYEMMQWSGQVGLNWREEATKATGR
ncbi:MAG: hypothetical protein JWM19_877 [Actinomycetia bacterium]|nr:hypothetical protein [Actinomycetes bacterium]